LYKKNLWLKITNEALIFAEFATKKVLITTSVSCLSLFLVMAFVDNEIYQLSEPNPYVTMGQEVDLKVMLTNAGAGHGFPNGPLDIYES
jgi:hypothetical protein